MLRRAAVLAVVLATCAFATEAQTPPSLIVQRAGPDGELADLNQANEIRVVFSEPMVTLGRIPQPVTAPFIRIEPAIRGAFRWSGTTILIFTPDQRQPLPFATTYQVTVDTTARAVSGRQLAAPYTFRFTTPTVKLLTVDHQRVQGRADRPALFFLRFNQPVQPATVLSHISARLQPHDWQRPTLNPAAEKLLAQQDPAGLQQFRAKVAAVEAVTKASSPVTFRLATEWETKAYPPSPDLVVLESVTALQPESWVRIAVDATVPSMQGPATPGREQAEPEPLEPALFVFGPACASQCDPSGYNAFSLRVAVAPARMRTRYLDHGRDGRQVGTRGSDRNPSAQRSVRRARRGLHPRRAALRYAAADDDLRGACCRVAGVGGRPASRVSVARAHRKLARARVHQFRRRPWRMGAIGRQSVAVLRQEFPGLRQWVTEITPENLMSTILQLTPRFREAPPGVGRPRTLSLVPDRIQSVGMDIAPALNGRSTGLVWAAIESGTPIPQSRRAGFSNDDRRRATIVQVTNLGVTVKDSPVNTLMITTPADGATYLIDPTLRMEFQTLPLRAVGAAGQVEWSINGRRVGRAPADGSETWPLERGKHLVLARDAHGRVAEASIVVR